MIRVVWRMAIYEGSKGVEGCIMQRLPITHQPILPCCRSLIDFD